MNKIVLQYDSVSNQVYGLDGNFIGNLTGPVTEVVDTQEAVITLVKQGVTTEEIIKLRNNGLI